MADREETQELSKTIPLGKIEVFDPEGKSHIVSRLNGHDMVSHLGFKYDIAKPSDKEKQVVVLVSKKSAPIDEKNTTKVNLTEMGADELRAFAKEHFDMEFAPQVDAKAILEAIMTEQAG